MFGLYLPRTWSPQSHVQPLRRRSAVLSFSPDRTAFFFPACYDDGRMTKLLEVAGLACRRGGRRVFDNLSFSLASGELLVLTGPNGSGKTTLLRALALLVPAEAGVVRWRGADVAADRESWRASLGWLGHLDGLKGDLTVRENLVVARRLRGEPSGDERIDDALAAFDLAPLARRAVRTLSAGQRRRTALARVVSSDAALWLLDEPLNALDADSQAALHVILEGHLDAGGLAIAATHAPLRISGAHSLELRP
jgi:heme exporter protein A